MRRLPKVIIIIINLSLIFTTFIGCQKLHPKPFLPYESFKSLQELEKSINSNLPIIYPDLSEYSFVEPTFHKVYKTNYSNVVSGYRIYGMLDTDKSDTNFWNLDFSCSILATSYTKSNPAPPLNINKEVMGIDVYEEVVDKKDQSRPDWYPDGTRTVGYLYEFDYQDCRYSVAGTVIIVPDKLKTLSDHQIEAMIENGKDEILGLVKSIVTKK